uniref:Uncharacterized protein n=1 Tax=viral metagenome TaxID=1070528 RepID=A0A6M3JXB9_9ZZZZ
MKLAANITKFTPSFWRKVGAFAVKWIREDTQKGIFQNDMRHDTYRSAQYKKYKQNDMRRFTKGKKLGYGRATQSSRSGGSVQSTVQGTRLKAYAGKSIASNQTSFVNMLLTGDLLKGLKTRTADNSSVTIAYDSADAGKLLGNEKYGRAMRTLRPANIDKVASLVSDFLDGKLKEWCSEPIKYDI